MSSSDAGESILMRSAAPGATVKVLPEFVDVYLDAGWTIIESERKGREVNPRDELTDIIASNRTEYANFTADRILAAGYSKPRETGGQQVNIPDEAIEAAAKAIYESESYLNKWDWPVAEFDREEYRRHARAAIAAAAPHVLQHFANRIDWRCQDCQDQLEAGLVLRLLQDEADK